MTDHTKRTAVDARALRLRSTKRVGIDPLPLLALDRREVLSRAQGKSEGRV